MRPNFSDKIDCFSLSTEPHVSDAKRQRAIRGNGRSGASQHLVGDPYNKLALAMIEQGVKHGDENWLRGPQCLLLVEALGMDHAVFLDGLQRRKTS